MTTSSIAAVQQLYLAYFNRAADAPGLAYWLPVVDAAGGNADMLADAFAASREFQDLVAGSSAAQMIDSVYQNLFGRPAEAAGLAWWNQQIQSGALSIADLVRELGKHAQGSDAAAMAQRIEAAIVASTASGSDTPPPSPRIQTGAPEDKFHALLGCSESWYGKFIQQAANGQPLTLTYSFMTAIPDYYNEALYARQPGVTRITGFQAPSAQMQAAVREILAAVGAQTGLSFVEVPDSLGGELRFGMSSLEGNRAGEAYLPGVDVGVHPPDPTSQQDLDDQGVNGDVWLNAAFMANASMKPGTAGYHVLLHEIGHALGMTHAKLGPGGLSEAENNALFTVMTESYDPSSVLGSQFGSYDMQALRYLYGTDASETAYNATVTRSFDGSAMRFGVGAAAATVLGTDLVDLIDGGAGNDVLFGRGNDDHLNGGAGNDTLDGGIGADHLDGGVGNDTLYGSWGKDRLDGGAGADTVHGGDGADVLIGHGDGDTLIGGDWAPATVPDVVDYSGAGGAVQAVLGESISTNDELLHPDGTRGYAYVTGSAKVAGAGTDVLININGIIGSAFDDVLSDSPSMAYDDTLYGGAGNDVLISHGGGNRAWSTHDLLVGGTGDDRYVLYLGSFSNAGFSVVELPGQGHDTLEVVGGAALFSMPEEVEDLVVNLAGTIDITGNAADNRMQAGANAVTFHGAAGNDVLIGGFGRDTLDGGAGADTLTGGAEADMFQFTLSAQAEQDIVTDFTFAAGDRIRLPAGMAYTVSSTADGSALLTLSNGSTVELSGVSASLVQTDWFI